MKKRILSLIILALTLISVFAFASCGKKEEKISCLESGCKGELEQSELDKELYVCSEDENHKAKLCVNEDCKKPIGVEAKVKYCPSCGTNQNVCSECSDNKIDGVYCTSCGRQVQKETSVREIFGKPWAEREKAISNSALILCFGMLGIFIVTGVIVTFIIVLNTIVEKARQAKENKK